LPKEAFDEADREAFNRPKTRSFKDRILFVQECRQKLLDFPALTRRDIAKQLGVTTARLNQILRSTQKDLSHGP
jgi:phage antirepressor YoqD-like protein